MSYLLFDCETAPDVGVEGFMPEALLEPIPSEEEMLAQELEDVTAPTHYKDPVKIADYIARKQRELRETVAERRRELVAKAEVKRQAWIDGCSLEPDLARLICLAFIGPPYRPDTSIVIPIRTEDDERVALREFWASFIEAQRRNLPIVGFNVLAFDLPLLLRRSQLLGVTHPLVSVDRYRSPVIDLLLKLTFNGVLKMRGLDWYCRRFGIAQELEDHPGKDMPQLAAQGQWWLIEQHARCDLARTQALAARLGYITVADAEGGPYGADHPDLSEGSERFRGGTASPSQGR